MNWHRILQKLSFIEISNCRLNVFLLQCLNSYFLKFKISKFFFLKSFYFKFRFCKSYVLKIQLKINRKHYL